MDACGDVNDDTLEVVILASNDSNLAQLLSSRLAAVEVLLSKHQDNKRLAMKTNHRILRPWSAIIQSRRGEQVIADTVSLS